jgi:hypothetical protein
LNEHVRFAAVCAFEQIAKKGTDAMMRWPRA